MRTIDVLTILSFIVTIFGIVLGLYAYKKSKRTKKLVFLSKNTKIISKKDFPFEKLSFQFNGKIIQDLVLTTFSIWNHGHKEIKFEDMIETDYLRVVSTNETLIYDVQTEIINPNNQVVVNLNTQKEIGIKFLYLNPSEGMLLRIYNNGNNSESFSLRGSFLGADEIEPAPEKGRYFKKYSELKCFDIFQRIIDSIAFMPLRVVVILILMWIYVPLMFLGTVVIGPFDFINDFWDKRIPKELRLNNSSKN